MKTVRLTTCPNAFEAELLKGRLESEGIPALLNNEIMSTYPPFGGVDVFINEEDLERATDILNTNQ